jgi:F-type H+-transporting ATPase subunit c
MAARMFAPKVASLVGSTSAKVARPVVRSSIKANGAQRAFSGMSLSIILTSSIEGSYP